MFGNKEGPTIIPERTVVIPEKRSCYDCKYFNHDMRVHRMMGPNEYETSCSHPEAWPKGSVLVGQHRQIGRAGSFGGGGDDSTPEWCPFLREDDE